MTDTNAVIAAYDSHSAAEDAVKELQKLGFDMKKLSVVGLSHGRASRWHRYKGGRVSGKLLMELPLRRPRPGIF